MSPLSVLRLLFAALLALCVCACDDDPEGPEAVDWQPAFNATPHGAFLSVWGQGPNAIWTVGGQPAAGVAWHYNGEAWSETPLPDGPGLNWVHGAGDVVWMVGNEGRALKKVGDGAWTETETGVTAALWGVFADGPNHAWAVGGDVLAEAKDPVLIEWDGSAWRRIDLPAIDRTVGALFKIWSAGDGHAVAVGSAGLILELKGGAWQQVASGTVDDLISVWGTSAESLVAVGGRSNGVLSRYTAGEWTSETLAQVPGLNGVWIDSDGRATLVGVRGTVLRMTPDGSLEQEPSGTREVLHGVWGTADGHRVTCGGSLLSSPPWDGVVLEDNR